MKLPALLLFTLPSLADPPRFAITSHTLDGGGGAMADVSGRFRLTGTTGQPDAAPLLISSDARFTLQPGFWNASTIIAVPDAPLLRFLPMPAGVDFVILAWPVTAGGWRLEVSTDISSGAWSPASEPVVDTPTDHTVTRHTEQSRLFFRLQRE